MFGNIPSIGRAYRLRFVGVAALAVLAFAATVDAKSGFKISSPDVGPSKPTANEFVFNGFGCSGGNQSPELRWSGAPAGTQSFAVSVYDPDAPTGSGWWHWYVVNLPASTTSLPRDAGKSDGSNGGQRFNALLFGRFFGHQHHGSRA